MYIFKRRDYIILNFVSKYTEFKGAFEQFYSWYNKIIEINICIS